MRARDYRHQAWNSLKGKWGVAILAFLIASLLGGSSTSGVSFNSNSPSVEININNPSEFFSQITDNLSSSLEIPAGVINILGTFLITFGIIVILTCIVLCCIGSIVEVGYSQFNIDIIDAKEPKIKTLFSFFKHWGVAIVSALLRTLYVILWTLLFIIPGIIAAYSYSMTPYILAENPEMSANDAISRSKELMKGHKWKLFCLELSFIGWNILCILTLGILVLWVEPYKHAAKAAFYRSLVPLPIQEETTDNSEFENNEF